MPNPNRFFLAKFIIFLIPFLQSFNCQADIIKLQKADSLFASKNYQEAMKMYENLLLEEEVFSPAMLLKMAFVSEGKGDYSSASFYLAKYYDQNPNPRVITKIKSLTEQVDLEGYQMDDSDRLFRFLTDLQNEISATLAFLLVISLILLIIFRKKADQPIHFLPSVFLIIALFVSNNFLSEPKTGIVTGSPTLIMDSPTAAGKLLYTVEPGHRVIIKSSKDIWYEVIWKDKKSYVKKDNVTRL
ncbi:tetratricopeptide repeat protein [Mariniradius saccharolyticus]|uniref:SH3 domain-containing protein n=1 Tax=Mariniradius sediminis TaxID=2909237 RepID=A0ABS9BXL5_9BACT|nr:MULTISPECIES: SH3 domain-containing protein [Mariniradius]MCF1752371.1 SH3 domain-containing protein [Mariniradius sediminis]